MRRSLVPLLAALALTSSPLVAQTRVGREQTLHRTTDAGRPVRVFTYVVNNPECQPRPPPPIVIKTPPSHGSITVGPGEIVPTVIREGTPDCSDRRLPGTKLTYTPAPGFHGVDQFDYDVLTGNSPRHDTAIIEVR